MINSNWIPMTEQLPPVDQKVLVYLCDDIMGIYTRTGDEKDYAFWEDEYGFYQEKDDVIAWMDLPDPPNIK